MDRHHSPVARPTTIGVSRQPPRHVEAVARDMTELVQEDGLEVDLGARVRVVRPLLPGEVGGEDQVAFA